MSFNFMAAVILEPKKIKSVTVSIVSPSICREVMGLNVLPKVFTFDSGSKDLLTKQGTCYIQINSTSTY